MTEAEVQDLRRDYGIMQTDRNILRTLLDETEAKMDQMHDKLQVAEARVLALRARVATLEAALRVIESHRRKCHEYDADVGDELRDFDVEDVILMEWQARAALQREGGE